MMSTDISRYSLFKLTTRQEPQTLNPRFVVPSMMTKTQADELNQLPPIRSVLKEISFIDSDQQDVAGAHTIQSSSTLVPSSNSSSVLPMLIPPSTLRPISSPPPPTTSSNSLPPTSSEIKLEPGLEEKKAAGSKKKYECTLCYKVFTTSGHLARHSRIHTGERNHICPHEGCGARFSRQDNCMQHFRTHSTRNSRKKPKTINRK